MDLAMDSVTSSLKYTAIAAERIVLRPSCEAVEGGLAPVRESLSIARDTCTVRRREQWHHAVEVALVRVVAGGAAPHCLFIETRLRAQCLLPLHHLIG